MTKKVFAKAGLIGLTAAAKAPDVGAEAGTTDRYKAKTAPGTMLGFLTAQSSAIQEAEALKVRVKELEVAAPLQKLDPTLIRPSKWANRHEASFSSAEFQALKDEIAAAGGNVQPIKVRPLSESGFELVYGHRRHRACLDLSLPVLATIEQVSDLSLFEQMERENRGRKNLSAWEQGVMYRRALDEGLYSSMRRLSEGLNLDLSVVSRSVALARLPEVIINAFSSPLDIQFKWAAPLTDAIQKDPDGTLQRARELSNAKAHNELSPSGILGLLIGGIDSSAGTVSVEDLTISTSGKVAAKLTTDSKGRAVLRFEPDALPESKRKALAQVVQDFLDIK
jgi:ParB family chromosome partitioning protein